MQKNVKREFRRSELLRKHFLRRATFPIFQFLLITRGISVVGRIYTVSAAALRCYRIKIHTKILYWPSIISYTLYARSIITIFEA